MKEQIEKETHVMTDDFKSYKGLKRDFFKHDTVNHSQKEYVRGTIHTNSVENYFSILKRWLTGIYQHVDARHLKRYIGEFDFRYNTRKVDDIDRTIMALKGIAGKRLLYRDSSYLLN